MTKIFTSEMIKLMSGNVIDKPTSIHGFSKNRTILMSNSNIFDA